MRLHRLFSPVLLIGSVLPLPAMAAAAGASADAPGMELEGRLSVDRYGAAVYSVPLTVPRGPGGLSPELSVVYNSHAAHGLLGYAWQLSGLSKLHRCVSIPALHNRRRGIFFSERDSLCLDGQFLQPLPSQSSADAMEYRTLPDQFIRVRANRRQAPDRFVVHTKPGSILEFGGRHQAWVERDDPSGRRRILAWLLSRVRDRSGNRIDFHYRRGGGEPLIDFIRYGPNHIRFHYQKKSRPLSAYAAGVPVVQEYLLSRVDIQTEQAEIRSYRFSYNEEDQLHEVSECVEQACLRATRFDWLKQAPWQLQAWGEGVYTQASFRSHQRFQSGDFNGDGLSDLYEVVGTGEHRAAVHLNQGDGSFLQHDGPWHRVDKNDDFSRFFSADFDGDGLSDVYHFRPEDDDLVYLSRSDDDAFSYASVAGVRRGQRADQPVLQRRRCLHSRCFRVADFNGDGRADVYHLRLASDADTIYLSDGAGGYTEAAGIVSDDGHGGAAAVQADRLRVGDFNGDGRADIYFIKPEAGGQDLVFLNLEDGRYRRVHGIRTDADLARDHGRGLLRVRLGDFNGDGLSDVYYASHLDAPDLIYLSHGDGQYTRRMGPLVKRPQSGDALSAALQSMKFADLNGDGRTDLYLIHEPAEEAADQVYLARTDGGLAAARPGLAAARSSAPGDRIKRAARLRFADFNGDGALDLVRLPADDEWMAAVYTAPRRSHLLKKIRTGLGGLHLIDYGLLPRASFHSRAPREAYPIVRTPPAVRVVSRVHHLGGSDDVFELYHYGGAKLSAAGEGFLGFDWFEQRRHNGLLAQRSDYLLDFPYQGALSRQREKILAMPDQDWAYGQPVSDSSYDYEQRLSGRKVPFPVLREVRRDAYEGHEGPVVRTFVRYGEYDAYGSAGRVETITLGADAVFTEQVTSRYRNDEERWILGKPEMVQILYDDGVHEEILRRTRFDYAEDTGLLLSKTVEPDHELGHGERYRYDNFGNQTGITAFVLNGSESRVQHKQYDKWGRFVVRIVNAAGHAESYQQDARFARPTRITDANGLITQRQYDAWGRLSEERRADGSRVTIRYLSELPADAPPHSAYAVGTDGHGFPYRTSYYDRHHRVLREEKTGFDGRPVRRDRVYDALGRRVRESFPYYADEEPVWTELQYDVLGRLTKKTWSLDGMPVEENIVHEGLRTGHVNESGLTRWLQYDAMKRVIQIDEPLDARIQFEYDAAGRLLSIRDADRNQITMNYDLFGRLLKVQDANRGERRFAYNAWGEKIAETDAGGNRFSQRYDALGRLLQRKGPDGSEHWIYDAKPNAVGKLVRESFNHYSREFNYDHHGRLAGTVDHRGYAFTWRYDQSGRLAQLRQPGGFVVERSYNRYGHLDAVRSPGISTEPQWVERAEQIDAWRSQARFYRLLANRLHSSTRPPFPSLIDAAQNLERGADRLNDSMTVPVGSLARALRCLERSLEILNQAGGLLDQAERTGHEFAALVYRAQALHRIEQSEACLQHAQRLNQDDQNLLYHWRVLRRDAAGRVELERVGNGWQTERVFDQASGRPLSIRSLHHGVKKRDWRYIYDQRGNLIQRQDLIAALSQWFDYDELDRLVSVTSHDEKNSAGHRLVLYHYDSHGNLQFDSHRGTYLYGGSRHAPHALSAVGQDHSYHYDAKGRLLDNQRLRVRWLSFDQPALIENKLNNQWLRFAYDTEHKLTNKTSSQGYQVDYAGKTYRRMERENQPSEECHTIYAEARMLADFCRRQRGGGRLFYYHHDALGSADALSDWSGKLLSRASYSAFGQCRGACLPAVAGVRRGFGGHERLAEVNLLHMNGRIYDPYSRQFLNPDAYQSPLHSTQAYNPYRYGLNNPFRYSDPSGYFVKSLVRKIKSAAEGAVSFVRRNARPLAASFVGYQLGSLAGGHFLRQAASQLIWSPGAMASGAYMAAYGEAVASSALAAGAVSGGASGLLAGGGIRGVLVNALSGGAFARLGVVYKDQWSPGRVLAGGLISGASSALQGGQFAEGALSYLQGGTLKALASAMRKSMIAQSSLDARNLGASSAGFMGDGIKLGGGRYNPSATAAAPSLMGGHQGQSGLLFGHPYAPGSWQDLMIEAYAGPHDYLNSFYWYDNFGNIRSGVSTAGRVFGEVLNYANLAPATPLVAASVIPDYFYALPAQ